MTDSDLARAAAWRFLAREHSVTLHTLDRHHVAMAVLEAAAEAGIDDPGDVDAGLVQAAIEQIKTVRVRYVWDDEIAPSREVDGLRRLLAAAGLPSNLACDACGTEFDDTDTRFDGHARYRSTSAYCRSCVDRCHEGDADHRCKICATKAAR